MSDNMNFDALLDANLDDLADLPAFESFPAGVHRATISIKQKVVNDKPGMEVSLTGIETVELSKPEEDKPITAGQVSSSLYFLDNEFGQGAFKKLIAPLAASLGVSSIRDLVDQCTGTEVEAVTSFRTNKKTGDTYFEIKKLIVS
jgi:copper oxidase (laccase) domain-containing protein